MEYLNKVAELHEDWIRIARTNYKLSREDAGDIVQNMYLELHSYDTKVLNPDDGRVNKDFIDLPTCERVLDKYGEVNRLFIWLMIRRAFHAQAREERKRKDVIVFSDVNYESEEEEDELERNEAVGILNDKIEAEKNNWHEYDRTIFELFMHERETWHNRSGKGISVKRLSELLSISESKLYNTIKNCKDRIREAVGNDYEDYNNNDFNKI